MREEFARMERAGAQATETAGPDFMRVKGSDRLDPQQLAVLKAVFEFRESEAERVDLPPYRVIGNDTLLHLAREPLSSLDDAPGMPPQLLRRSGNRIKAEIQRALRGPGVERPISPAATSHQASRRSGGFRPSRRGGPRRGRSWGWTRPCSGRPPAWKGWPATPPDGLKRVKQGITPMYGPGSDESLPRSSKKSCNVRPQIFRRNAGLSQEGKFRKSEKGQLM